MQGVVNVPFWGYWTSPEIVAIIDHIPNGWVMFNGDMTNDPCSEDPIYASIICETNTDPVKYSFVIL